MANVKPLPILLPVLGVASRQITLVVGHGGHDQVDSCQLPDRGEAARRNNGQLHPSLAARAEQGRQDVAGADMLEVLVPLGSGGIQGEDVHEKRLEMRWGKGGENFKINISVGSKGLEVLIDEVVGEEGVCKTGWRKKYEI